MNNDLVNISQNFENLLRKFLKDYPQKEGSVFVIGCSSSEIAGGVIGKNSNVEIGKAIFMVAEKVLKENKIFLACQCCEHLNRALVVEKECAEKYDFEEVSVVPWEHGGGSFASAAYRNFKNPCVVEKIKATCGLDIGDTLIGMHLKEVAVPVHFGGIKIGSANIVGAYSRPKLIGGERARYKL